MVLDAAVVGVDALAARIWPHGLFSVLKISGIPVKSARRHSSLAPRHVCPPCHPLFADPAKSTYRSPSFAP